jgi:predicted phosphodiesterase
MPADAPDDEMARAYAVLGAQQVVYGHIHQPFVRRLSAFTVANSGAVGLPYDGDPRAAYAVVDGDRVEVRRVPYDPADEIRLLERSGDPFAASTIGTLRTGKYVPVK